MGRTILPLMFNGRTRAIATGSAAILLASTLLAGCITNGGGRNAAPEHNLSSVTARLASRLDEQAMRALAAGDAERAIDLLERVVEATPDDAGYRLHLAQAYLRAGRFLSADQSYGDVITLMPDNDKARVAQAVARLGRGDVAGARAVLADASRAPAEDLGLALSLAGDDERAIAVLERASEGMRGTSRTRQNLAMAYALAGQWDKARAMAERDLSAADTDRRMEQWAGFARPGGRAGAVTALLGVTAVSDGGQPVALALANAKSADMQMAATQPAAVQPGVASPPDAATLPDAGTIADMATPDANPSVPAMTATASQSVPVATVAAMAGLPPSQPARGWAVQLGAYSSDALLDHGWNVLAARFPQLRDYARVSSDYVDARGDRLQRLSVAGFASRGAAQSLCANLRSSGGQCFVRFIADGAVRSASL